MKSITRRLGQHIARLSLLAVLGLAAYPPGPYSPAAAYPPGPYETAGTLIRTIAKTIQPCI